MTEKIKEFSMDVTITGTATLVVKAKNKEEAIKLFEEGLFEEGDCYYDYEYTNVDIKNDVSEE